MTESSSCQTRAPVLSGRPPRALCSTARAAARSRGDPAALAPRPPALFVTCAGRARTSMLTWTTRTPPPARFGRSHIPGAPAAAGPPELPLSLLPLRPAAPPAPDPLHQERSLTRGHLPSQPRPCFQGTSATAAAVATAAPAASPEQPRAHAPGALASPKRGSKAGKRRDHRIGSRRSTAGSCTLPPTAARAPTRESPRQCLSLRLSPRTPRWRTASGQQPHLPQARQRRRLLRSAPVPPPWLSPPAQRREGGSRWGVPSVHPEGTLLVVGGGAMGRPDH